MYNNNKISIVIPCYNEEKGLEEVLKTKPPFIDEIIVVDNNSTDTTTNVAKKYSTIVVHEKKRGYGQAYQSGLSVASGDIIVTLDGDNSYRLSNLDKIFPYMEEGHYDFVVGCRFPLIYKNVQPVINTIANYFISWLIRILFKINLKDSQSGMMVFKRGILDKIKVHSTGMVFTQEIKIKAFLNPKIKCGEIHISYFPRIGKSKFSKIDALKSLCSTLFLFKKLLRKKLY